MPVNDKALLQKQLKKSYAKTALKEFQANKKKAKQLLLKGKSNEATGALKHHVDAQKKHVSKAASYPYYSSHWIDMSATSFSVGNVTIPLKSYDTVHWIGNEFKVTDKDGNVTAVYEYVSRGGFACRTCRTCMGKKGWFEDQEDGDYLVAVYKKCGDCNEES